MQKYVIALYIRLSIEDCKYDSMSIENQRLVLNEYAAGSRKLQPTAKLASSPTNAVVVPLMINLRMILINSIITPATGPKAKVPINTGSSLKSSL